MVNLIPPSAKKSVIIEYWLRVLTVWLVIATGISLLFTLTFLPVYVLVDAKIDAYQESAAAASQKIASFESVSRDLARATEQSQLLIASTRSVSLSEVITILGSLENNGIELNSVLISRAVAGGVEPVRIDGVARDRQALADFRDRLLAQDSIEAVDFPISNLAQDRDIFFSITITMSNTSNL